MKVLLRKHHSPAGGSGSGVGSGVICLMVVASVSTLVVNVGVVVVVVVVVSCAKIGAMKRDARTNGSRLNAILFQLTYNRGKYRVNGYVTFSWNYNTVKSSTKFY